MLGVDFLIASTVVGGLSGAILGAALRTMLAGRLGRTPIGLLLVGGLFMGFCWGASVGIAGVAIADLHIFGATETLFMAGLLAGVAGAAQFGWFWLPYTILTARGRSSIPLILVASLLGLGLGWLSILTIAIF